MTVSIIGDLYEAVRQVRICQRFGRLCGLSPWGGQRAGQRR